MKNKIQKHKDNHFNRGCHSSGKNILTVTSKLGAEAREQKHAKSTNGTQGRPSDRVPGCGAAQFDQSHTIDIPHNL